MSSLRATIAEARACLERVNSPDANATVKRILGKKAELLIKDAEVCLQRREDRQRVAASLGLESIPAPLADALIAHRNEPATEPITVMVCPELSREQFLEWKAKQEKENK